MAEDTSEAAEIGLIGVPRKVGIFFFNLRLYDNIYMSYFYAVPAIGIFYFILKQYDLL